MGAAPPFGRAHCTASASPGGTCSGYHSYACPTRLLRHTERVNHPGYSEKALRLDHRPGRPQRGQTLPSLAENWQVRRPQDACLCGAMVGADDPLNTPAARPSVPPPQFRFQAAAGAVLSARDASARRSAATSTGGQVKPPRTRRRPVALHVQATHDSQAPSRASTAQPRDAEREP